MFHYIIIPSPGVYTYVIPKTNDKMDVPTYQTVRSLYYEMKIFNLTNISSEIADFSQLVVIRIFYIQYENLINHI